MKTAKDEMRFQFEAEEAFQAMEKIIHERPDFVHNFIWLAMMATRDKVTTEEAFKIVNITKRRVDHCHDLCDGFLCD